MNDVAGILLNYQTRKDIIHLAETLLKQKHITPLVIDNSSDKKLEYWCVQNHIKYIDTGENLGYTGGNNVGIKASIIKGYEYAFILNPDIEIKTLDILGMVEVMEQGKADILFPEVLELGEKFRERLPTIENRVLRATGNIPPLSATSDDRTKYIDHGPGSAMMIRLAMIDDIGYLREEFFMYNDEVEFCYRARRAGYNIAIYLESVVAHTREDDNFITSEFRLYYQTRNKILMNYLLFDFSTSYTIFIILYIINTTLGIFINGNLSLFYPFVYGVIDGVFLKSGRMRY